MFIVCLVSSPLVCSWTFTRYILCCSPSRGVEKATYISQNHKVCLKATDNPQQTPKHFLFGNWVDTFFVFLFCVEFYADLLSVQTAYQKALLVPTLWSHLISLIFSLPLRWNQLCSFSLLLCILGVERLTVSWYRAQIICPWCRENMPTKWT